MAPGLPSSGSVGSVGARGTRRLAWDREGRDWPNRSASRFVEAAGLRWHVQQLGSGPVVLLVHGTGAATHSWRDLAPLLAREFTVIAVDLPGHGFTDNPGDARLSLPGMARSLAVLLVRLGVAPRVVVGHSAGAAILARMCLDATLAPSLFVSLNGALLPLRGLAGRVFSPLARLLALNPLVPRFFTWRAGDPEVVRRLVGSTGSVLDDRGLALYGLLVRDLGHVAGALGMMAHWDLEELERDLPRLRPSLLLVAGERDGTVPPADAVRAARAVPGARTTVLAGLGHLAHEEQPQTVADLIARAARDAGVLPA
ncbi:MAG: alpha/beta fold hydrolase BchO [Betaproteobacteria bacterium]